MSFWKSNRPQPEDYQRPAAPPYYESWASQGPVPGSFQGDTLGYQARQMPNGYANVSWNSSVAAAPRIDRRAMAPQRVPDVMSPNDIIIAVMGITGSGKTTFISRCMGEDVGIGHDLHSCTQDVAIHSFRHRGRVIRLIDTPGFDDTAKADVVILNNIAFWLSHAYRAEPKLLLSGIIYLHPVSDTRMVGTATKNLEMMKRLCGEQNLPAIWLATTMWGLVHPSLGNAREQELVSTEQFWGGLVQRGSKVCRHHDSDASAFAILDHIISSRPPVALNIQIQMVDEHRDVDQTDAGRYLRRNVIQEQENVRQRLDRNAEELEEKFAAQETAGVEELLQRQLENQRKLDEKSKSLQAMRLDMDRLREQKAREFAEREQEFAREKQTQADQMARLDQQVQDLQHQRDAAIKKAEDAAAQRGQLEDSNFHLMLQRDQAAIADIDRAIAYRKAEEERIQAARTQTVKKESVFKKTLKVSMAETLVHGLVHATVAMCVVM